MADNAAAAGSGAVDVLWVDVRARTDESSFREMEAQAGASGERAGEATGGGLKGKLGAAFAALPAMALAAGAAVGAALAAGLKSAVDIAQQVNAGQKDMQASLGVTAAEAEKLGEVAKKVFGNNWGADLKGAQQAVLTVRREIQGLADADLQRVVEGSIAISERFEQDQAAVAAAVKSLMLSTGQSAEEALDFITAGFQKGLDSSGDFLDTLNEYAPQFEKARITGGELFSLLETGAAKGALGVDKVADAFKEFGLTIIDVNDDSSAVYRELGLDQARLTKQINDGSLTQAQAFELVTNKLAGVKGAADRARIGAAIFGGAGEDFANGLVQLDLTKTKTEQLAGSTGKVKDATNSMSAVFQTAFRQFQLALEPAGQELLKLANDAMPYVTAAIEKLSPIVVDVVRRLVEGFRQAREGVQPMLPVVQKLGDLFQSVFGLIRDLWLNVLQPVLAALAPAFEIAFNAVSNIVTTVLGVVTGVINAVSALLRGDFSAAWAAISGVVVGAFEGVKKHVTEFLPAMEKFGTDLGKQILNGLQSGLDGLQALILASLARALNTLADKLPGVLAPLARKLADAASEAAERNAADAAARRPNGPVYGPQFGGTANTNIPEETGRYGLAFISTLTEKFKNDPKVSSDCAIIASAILNEIGIGIKSSVGAKQLMQNALDAQFKQVDTSSYKNFRPGDLLTYEGPEYGALKFDKNGQKVGYHSAVFAGFDAQNRPTAIENPGSSNTRLRVLTDDELNKLIVLRSPTSPFAQSAIDQPKLGNPPPAPAGTVPLPTVEEQKTYSLSLADWNKHSREALAIAQQLKEANVSTDAGFILRVRARAEAFKAEGDQEAASLAFAQERLSRVKATEKEEQETALQRDQRLRREQLAQEKLEASIRKAGEARLNQIIKIGVTSTNSLEKINLAEGELERRGKLSVDAAKAAAVAREKAAKEAAAANENALANVESTTAREREAVTRLFAQRRAEQKQAAIDGAAARETALENIESTTTRENAALIRLFNQRRAELAKINEQAAQDEEDRIQRVLRAYVYQAQERGRIMAELAAEEARLNAAINDSAAQESQTRIDLIRDRLTLAEDTVPDFQALRAELDKMGRPLTDLIALADTYAKRTDVDTASARNFLEGLKALEVQTRRNLALDGPVAARGTVRPPTLGQLQQFAPQEMGPAVPARGGLTADQVKFQEEVYKKERIEEYRRSLADLTITQLEQAQALALANGEQERYNVLTAELTARIAALKDQEINVTFKIAGLDTGIKALDLYKSAIEGVAGVIRDTFSALASGAGMTAGTVLKSFGLMALGIVKQVAVAIVAMQAQLIAMQLLALGTAAFDPTALFKAAAILAASAAIAGIAAGLESRLTQKVNANTAAVSQAGAPLAQSAAQNASVSIPNSSVSIIAAPEWTAIMSRAVDKFDSAVDRFAQSGVRVTVASDASRGTLGAFALTTP